MLRDQRLYFVIVSRFCYGMAQASGYIIAGCIISGAVPKRNARYFELMQLQ